TAGPSRSPRAGGCSTVAANRSRRLRDARRCGSAPSSNTSSHIFRNDKAPTRATSAFARTPSTSAVRAPSKIWRRCIGQKSNRERLRNECTFKLFAVLGRLVRLWSSGIRIEVVDAEGVQNAHRASAPASDRVFAFAVPQIDLNDANGLQQLPRLLRRDVDV